MSDENRIRQRASIIISIFFVALFALIRSVPVEPCEVLHYGDYMNDEGAVEYCGEEETAFFDMTEIRYPIEIILRPTGEVASGERATFDLYLKDHQGLGIAHEDIVVSHTERIHLMAVDPSLSDYQHLHPQPVGAPGHYQFEITPSEAGTYHVFLDFISLKSQRRVLAKSEFVVEGEPSSVVIEQSHQISLDGYSYTLRAPLAGGFPVAKESQLELEVVSEDETRRPEFGLVMGAYAHLVVFDEAGRGFAHLHPQNPFIEKQDPRDPDLRFSFFPGDVGKYRLWAQLMVDGRERFVPFDIEVVATKG